MLDERLESFNWGAFFWSWIWALRYGIWIGLLALIPGVGLIMRFILGFRGNRWAAQHNVITNMDQFLLVQRRWGLAGIIVFIIIPLSLMLWATYKVTSSPVTQAAYKLAKNNFETIRNLPEALGGSLSLKDSENNEIVSFKVEEQDEGIEITAKAEKDKLNLVLGKKGVSFSVDNIEEGNILQILADMHDIQKDDDLKVKNSKNEIMTIYIKDSESENKCYMVEKTDSKRKQFFAECYDDATQVFSTILQFIEE